MTYASEDSDGGIGAVVREGCMSAKGGFGEKDFLSAAEANAIADRITSEKQGAENIRIADVHTVASNVVAVTLNGKLQHVDYQDFLLSAPAGSWKSLTPAFRNLQLKKAATATNRFGNTVILFETVEQFGDDATIVNEQGPGGFSGDLDDAINKADNLVSWQMEHGGWTKAMPYDRLWNGVEKKSSQFGPTGMELGTIDNNATINELRFITAVYRETGTETYKDSVRKGIGFLLAMQYETGGWPQVYPERGTPGDSVYYSNYVTFNDNAMINVLDLIDDIVNKKYPFDTDLIEDETISHLEQARDKGIEYILNSQIRVNGVQHSRD